MSKALCGDLRNPNDKHARRIDILQSTSILPTRSRFRAGLTVFGV